MLIDIPYRIDATEKADTKHIQANFESIVNTIRISISTSGDIIITTPGSGLIVTTPDGLHTWRIRVNNSGDVETEQVT